MKSKTIKILTTLVLLVASFLMVSSFSFASSGRIPVYDENTTQTFVPEQVKISTSDVLYTYMYNLQTTTPNQPSQLKITVFGYTQTILLNDDATVRTSCQGEKVGLTITTKPKTSQNSGGAVSQNSDGTYTLKANTVYYLTVSSSNYAEMLTSQSTYASRTAWVYVSYSSYHDFVQQEAKEPTCTEVGWEAYEVCKNCGYTTTYKELPIKHELTHEHKNAGYLSNGYDYDKCQLCGAVINKKTLPGYSTSYVKSFKVKKGKKCFTAKWKKQSKANQKKFNGYQLRYSTKSNMTGAKTVNLSKASKSKKIKGLSKKTRYYVQIRSYVKTSKGTFYSKWSTKSVVTK